MHDLGLAKGLNLVHELLADLLRSLCAVCLADDANDRLRIALTHMHPEIVTINTDAVLRVDACSLRRPLLCDLIDSIISVQSKNRSLFKNRKKS